MDFKIYSPSYKRASGVKTHKVVPNVIYCVHEFEADKYIENGYKVKILPNEIRGNISRVRNYIKDNYISSKGIIIDDDIEKILQWTVVHGVPMQVPVLDLETFFHNGFTMCEEIGAKLWGVNILGDKGSYREYTPFGTTNTVSASFMGFLDNNLSFDETLPLKDDYDFCIQNLNTYRKILRYNAYSLVKKDHGNVGGCADYRSVEVEMEQLKLMQKKWGSKIVRNDLTQKGKKTKIFDINPVVKTPIKGV